MIDFILSHTNPYGCKSSLTLKSIFGRKNCQFFMFMPDNFLCRTCNIQKVKKHTLMLSILKDRIFSYLFVIVTVIASHSALCNVYPGALDRNRR